MNAYSSPVLTLVFPNDVPDMALGTNQRGNLHWAKRHTLVKEARARWGWAGCDWRGDDSRVQEEPDAGDDAGHTADKKLRRK